MAAKTKKETAAVAETKETAKKATVKKTREVYLQWYGKEVQLSSITARIEEMWKKEMKRNLIIISILMECNCMEICR